MSSKLAGSFTSSNSEARTSTGSAGGWGEGAITEPTAEPLPFFSAFELMRAALPFWIAEELNFVAATLQIPTDR